MRDLRLLLGERTHADVALDVELLNAPDQRQRSAKRLADARAADLVVARLSGADAFAQYPAMRPHLRAMLSVGQTQQPHAFDAPGATPPIAMASDVERALDRADAAFASGDASKLRDSVAHATELFRTASAHAIDPPIRSAPQVGVREAAASGPPGLQPPPSDAGPASAGTLRPAHHHGVFGVLADAALSADHLGSLGVRSPTAGGAIGAVVGIGGPSLAELAARVPESTQPTGATTAARAALAAQPQPQPQPQLMGASVSASPAVLPLTHPAAVSLAVPVVVAAAVPSVAISAGATPTSNAASAVPMAPQLATGSAPVATMEAAPRPQHHHGVFGAIAGAALTVEHGAAFGARGPSMAGAIAAGVGIADRSVATLTTASRHQDAVGSVPTATATPQIIDSTTGEITARPSDATPAPAAARATVAAHVEQLVGEHPRAVGAVLPPFAHPSPPALAMPSVASAPAVAVSSAAATVVQPDLTITGHATGAPVPTLAEAAGPVPAAPAPLSAPTAGAAAPAIGATAPAPTSRRGLQLPVANAAAAVPSKRALGPRIDVGGLAPLLPSPAAAGVARATARVIDAPSVAPTPAAPSSALDRAGAEVAAVAPASPQVAVVVPMVPLTPGLAAPRTESALGELPVIPAVHAGSAPQASPTHLVQSTVSLVADRAAVATALQAEAQTRARVGGEANAQREAMLDSLGAGPRAAADSGAAIDASASAEVDAATIGAETQSAGLAATATQTLGARVGGAPPIVSPDATDAFLARAAPSAVHQANAQLDQAVASASLGAPPATLDGSTAQQAAIASRFAGGLAPFDPARFLMLDQQGAALPRIDTTPVDDAHAAAATAYQQGREQFEQISQFPVPNVQLPSAAPIGTAAPNRAAAIANVEREVSRQAVAGAPAAMQAALTPVQQQTMADADTARAEAQSQAAAQTAQHVSNAATISARLPPVTAAQAAQEAQAQYQAHQLAAAQAGARLNGEVAAAQIAAGEQTTAATAARDQQLASGQQAYQQTVQGQLLPQYGQQHQQATGQLEAQRATVQQQATSEAGGVHADAQAQVESAHGQTTAEIQHHRSSHRQHHQHAIATHHAHVAVADAHHDAQVASARQQVNRQVDQHRAAMDRQVTEAQAAAQHEANQQLDAGEHAYQQTMAEAAQRAGGEHARGNQQAAAHQQQADSARAQHTGVGGWIEQHIAELDHAAKAALEATKNTIVSIMETARQAAIGVLQRARQSALASLARGKSAVQGIISACASTIHAVIAAAAQLVRNLIRSLADTMNGYVADLTAALGFLVRAYTVAVNETRNGLIASLALVDASAAVKLQAVTQRYQDAFNDGAAKLQGDISGAGAQLTANVQRAAAQASAHVDGVQATLDAATNTAQQGLNQAVDSAYHAEAAVINFEFDAAEAGVNASFRAAEATTKAYFALQMGDMAAIKRGLHAIGHYVVEAANQVLAGIAKVAMVVAANIPDSWNRAFISFWNSPWRTTIIIGLATVAAVALTVATGGIAGVLLAGVLGGALAGGTYFGGEAVAREGEVHLAAKTDTVYIPGLGDAKIGADGQPTPPADLKPEQRADWERQAKWALSNFELKRNDRGEVIGHERKSDTEIGQYAAKEGIDGFGAGFVSGALAATGGGVAGAAVKSLEKQLVGRVMAKTVLESVISNVIQGPIQQSLSTAWTTGFEALQDNKSPSSALAAAWDSCKDQLSSPGAWVSAMVMMGISPAKLKLVTPRLTLVLKDVESEALKRGSHKTADIAIDTLGQSFGGASEAFLGAYYQAIKAHKPQGEALAEGRKAADSAFSIKSLLTTTLMNTSGHLGQHGQNQQEIRDEYVKDLPNPANEPLDPHSVGALFEKTGQTIDSIKGNPDAITEVAAQLLEAKLGWPPSENQKIDAAFQLDKAIEAGTWQKFTPDGKKSLIGKVDSVQTNLGNIFHEKKLFSPDELTYDNLREVGKDNHLKQLREGNQSGTSGMVLAATFIDTPVRSRGDFSHAYGEQSWKGLVKAQTMLEGIPKGKFVDSLDIKLLEDVNRLIHSPAPGLKASMVRDAACAIRGWRDEPGVLRSGRSFGVPERVTPAELANIKESGMIIHEIPMMPVGEDGSKMIYTEMPPVPTIKPGLEQIIATLKTDLAAPDADPISAAAAFERKFVGLHPFGDSNGRTGRILMNRILADYDLVPAILSDQNHDVSLSPQQWRTEVAKGIGRTRAFLDNETAVERPDSFLSDQHIHATVAPLNARKRIVIDQAPYALGKDGMLYDLTGRPWLVENNQLVPIAQFEYSILARRLSQLGPEKACTRLDDITAATRELFNKTVADPTAVKDVNVRGDQRARAADMKLTIDPSPEIGKLLAGLSDVEPLIRAVPDDPMAVFEITKKGAIGGTPSSHLLSKYSQMDLELWQLENGLRHAHQPDQAARVHANRIKLFALAKRGLELHRDPRRISSENPLGFRYRWEKVAFDTSPLKYDTLEQATKELGDSRMTVWRSDYAQARLIGMQPDSVLFKPDGMDVAKSRANKGQIANYYDDFNQLVNSAGYGAGSQYISLTSEPGMLATEGHFDAPKGQAVPVDWLPGPIKNRLLAWLDPQIPDGLTRAEEKALREAAKEKGQSVAAKGKSLLTERVISLPGLPGAFVKLKLRPADNGKVFVELPRKVFEFVVDKNAVLPGVPTLSKASLDGIHAFEGEQEVHALRRIAPWRVSDVFEQKTLREEFPITAKSSEEKAAAKAEMAQMEKEEAKLHAKAVAHAKQADKAEAAAAKAQTKAKKAGVDAADPDDILTFEIPAELLADGGGAPPGKS